MTETQDYSTPLIRASFVTAWHRREWRRAWFYGTWLLARLHITGIVGGIILGQALCWLLVWAWLSWR